MKDAIDPLDRPVHGGGVDDVALDQLDAVAEGGQVRQIAGAEIIEHADAVAALDEGFGDMGTDESGPAGYEESSHECVTPVGKTPILTIMRHAKRDIAKAEPVR